MKQFTAKDISHKLGVSLRYIRKKANTENWPFSLVKGNGGNTKIFAIEDLPKDIQKSLLSTMGISESLAIASKIGPWAALSVVEKLIQSDAYEMKNVNRMESMKSIDRSVIEDQRVQTIARIIQKATEVPDGWKKRKWVEHVAEEETANDPNRSRPLTYQTIYKWLKKYEKGGLTALKHSKKNKGNPKVWDKAALDFWFGLCLKRSHRKHAKDSLYDILVEEASKRGWRIGSYRSAMWWYEKNISPQLEAFQKGGIRALDNILPPVLRSYADMAPFEIIVGDQHRFDFWVKDDLTGEVFRPEGYMWQDLRTRMFYGMSMDKKYDSYLMGLALRMGCSIFGKFGSIYTDHGKPETSNYIKGVVHEMRTLGLREKKTEDYEIEDACDPEENNPLMVRPGTHRKAIVRNAKAKMIEGTFNVLEGILVDHLHCPGYCKRLSDTGEVQEIDQKEIERLIASEKILTFSEFVLNVLKAMDYYNKRHHRGVFREWKWREKPKETTPWKCLEFCYLYENWRPKRLRIDELNSVFLAKSNKPRTIRKGRIEFRSELYESDEMIQYEGKKIDIQFDPLDPYWINVYYKNKYISTAWVVERSSMIDEDLASRKIAEKRRKRRAVIDEYKQITSDVPDFIEYSKIDAHPEPPKRQTSPMTEDEMKAVVASTEVDTYEDIETFSRKADRFEYCKNILRNGGEIPENHIDFFNTYINAMTDEEKEQFEIEKEVFGYRINRYAG